MDSSASEEKYMTEYAAKHPYPSYNEISENLPMDQYAEYGEFNHEACQLMYENINDEELCLSYAEEIYERGGMQALQMNFYTLCQYSPFGKDSLCRAVCAALLTAHWDGVGEWES